MESNVTVIHNESGNSFSFLSDDWQENYSEITTFFLGIEIVGRFPKDKFSFCRDKSNELKQFQGLSKLTEQQKEALQKARDKSKEAKESKEVRFTISGDDIVGIMEKKIPKTTPEQRSIHPSSL